MRFGGVDLGRRAGLFWLPDVYLYSTFSHVLTIGRVTRGNPTSKHRGHRRGVATRSYVISRVTIRLRWTRDPQTQRQSTWNRGGGSIDLWAMGALSGSHMVVAVGTVR